MEENEKSKKTIEGILRRIRPLNFTKQNVELTNRRKKIFCFWSYNDESTHASQVVKTREYGTEKQTGEIHMKE